MWVLLHDCETSKALGERVHVSSSRRKEVKGVVGLVGVGMLQVWVAGSDSRLQPCRGRTRLSFSTISMSVKWAPKPAPSLALFFRKGLSLVTPLSLSYKVRLLSRPPRRSNSFLSTQSYTVTIRGDRDSLGFFKHER